MYRSSTLAMLFFLAGIACRRGMPACGGLSSDDVAAIRNNQQTWLQAIRNGDWDSAAGLHAEDAIRLPPNGSDERGRSAIHASLAKIERAPRAVTGRVLEIEGCGDLAYAWSTLSITFPSEGASGVSSLHGKGHRDIPEAAGG